MKYDKFGRELPDPTPIEVPLHLRGREPTLAELVAMHVRREMAQVDGGAEELFSDAEAEDIEDLPSRYEVDANVEEEVESAVRHSRRARRKDGIDKAVEGARESGQTRGQGEADGKPQPGAAAGDSEKAGSSAESAGKKG